MSISIMIIFSDRLMIMITTPLASHLESLPIAAFDPGRFGAAHRLVALLRAFRQSSQSVGDGSSLRQQRRCC